MKKVVRNGDCTGRRIEAQDPNNDASILAKSEDFESYYDMNYHRAMLRPSVTREWVGEGVVGAARELDYFSAHIRLREFAATSCGYRLAQVVASVALPLHKWLLMRRRLTCGTTYTRRHLTHGTACTFASPHVGTWPTGGLLTSSCACLQATYSGRRARRRLLYGWALPLLVGHLPVGTLPTRAAFAGKRLLQSVVYTSLLPRYYHLLFSSLPLRKSCEIRLEEFRYRDPSMVSGVSHDAVMERSLSFRNWDKIGASVPVGEQTADDVCGAPVKLRQQLI
ncbi:hypothetical protein GW17_00011048 [Ensete ventricosum]|nr:hypothetical protein GW17_00011048 [Ensete ventricosum]